MDVLYCSVYQMDAIERIERYSNGWLYSAIKYMHDLKLTCYQISHWCTQKDGLMQARLYPDYNLFCLFLPTSIYI